MIRQTLKPALALYETNPRATASNSVTLTSGRLISTGIYLPAGISLASISVWSAATPATNPTNQIFGLYNTARALLRSTVDDLTAAWAASTKKTLLLTSAYPITVAGLYYIGIMVAAATPPTITAHIGNAALNAGSPFLNGVHDTGLTTALPDPMIASTGTSATSAYAYVS